METSAGTPRFYTGVWTNQANGQWILTLPAPAGTFVFTLAVFYVGAVASTSWSILKCIIYVLGVRNAKKKEEENLMYDLHSKRQLVMRNSGSALQAALQLGAVRRDAWSRPRHGRRSSWWRLCTAEPNWEILVCVLFIVFWGVCTNLASLVSLSTDNTVLLIPNTCGNQTAGINPADLSEARLKRSADVDKYYKTCYADSRSGEDPLCASLPSSTLPYTVQDAECPFADRLCITTNSTPVRIESDYLNTNRHLGVNTKSSDGVEFRSILTCSPIHERSTEFDAVPAEDDCGEGEPRLLGLEYGPSEVSDSFHGLMSGNLVSSEQTANVSVSADAKRHSTSGHELSLYTVYYEPGFEHSTHNWHPDQSLFDVNTSQSTALHILSKVGTVFIEPSYDPWLLANESSPITNPTVIGHDKGGQYFKSPRPASILGCVSQVQVCLPGKVRDCSDPMSYNGMYDVFSVANSTFAREFDLHVPPFNDVQNATIRQAMDTTLGWDLSRKPSDTSLTINPLAATMIPKDQWRREVERWFAHSLASLQMHMVEWVVGLSDSQFPKNGFQHDQATWTENCRLQRSRDVSGKVINLSMTALVIIFCIGTALIAAGICVELFYGLPMTKAQDSMSSRALWTRDSILEIESPATTPKGEFYLSGLPQIKGGPRVTHYEGRPETSDGSSSLEAKNVAPPAVLEVEEDEVEGGRDGRRGSGDEKDEKLEEEHV